MFPRSVKRFTFYQFSVQPAEPLNVLLMVRSPDSLSSQLVTRGGVVSVVVVERGGRGGGADWVTPIPTHDSRAEAETPYRIHRRRTVPSRIRSTDRSVLQLKEKSPSSLWYQLNIVYLFVNASFTMWRKWPGQGEFLLDVTPKWYYRKFGSGAWAPRSHPATAALWRQTESRTEPLGGSLLWVLHNVCRWFETWNDTLEFVKMLYL